MTDALVSGYIRILVAVAMQHLSNLMAKSSMWAFSFAYDMSTHICISFMDQRLRLAVNGLLVNLHLLAIPMFYRHTAVNQFNPITKVMDAMNSNWRDKLIGHSWDGENTMTGCSGGVITLLEKQATNGVLRVRCPAHQIDLVIMEVLAMIEDGLFVEGINR